MSEMQTSPAWLLYTRCSGECLLQRSGVQESFCSTVLFLFHIKVHDIPDRLKTLIKTDFVLDDVRCHGEKRAIGLFSMPFASSKPLEIYISDKANAGINQSEPSLLL